MSNLDMFTNKQLENELKQRKQLKLKAPPLIEPIDLVAIVAAVEDYIKMLPTPKHRSDNETHVFEAVLLACYGKAIWPWLRSIQK